MEGNLFRIILHMKIILAKIKLEYMMGMREKIGRYHLN